MHNSIACWHIPTAKGSTPKTDPVQGHISGGYGVCAQVPGHRREIGLAVVFVSYMGGAMGVVVGGGTGTGTDLEATDVFHPTPAFVVLIETL